MLSRLGELKEAAVAALDYIDRTCDSLLEEDDEEVRAVDCPDSEIVYRPDPPAAALAEEKRIPTPQNKVKSEEDWVYVLLVCVECLTCLAGLSETHRQTSTSGASYPSPHLKHLSC